MIEVTTKNNKKDYRSFLAYNTFIINRKIAYPIIFFCLGLALLIVGLATGYYLYSYVSIMFFIFSFLFFILNYLAILKLMKKLISQAKDFEKLENHYIFDINNMEAFKVISNNEQKNDKEIKYNPIKLCLERKNYFYLYVARNLAFMINKRRMSGGDLLEIRKIFEVKYSKNFKSKYYKKGK